MNRLFNYRHEYQAARTLKALRAAMPGKTFEVAPAEVWGYEFRFLIYALVDGRRYPVARAPLSSFGKGA